MKNPALDNLQIFKSINAVVVPYIQKCNLQQGTRVPANPLEQYSLDCFEAVRNVTNCIEQLDFAAELLSGYRASTAPNSMNRHDHIDLPPTL